MAVALADCPYFRTSFVVVVVVRFVVVVVVVVVVGFVCFVFCSCSRVHMHTCHGVVHCCCCYRAMYRKQLIPRSSLFLGYARSQLTDQEFMERIRPHIRVGAC